MKTVTFNIDDLQISLSNDWAGFETVMVDEKKVSKKFSFSGTKHNFKINNNNNTDEYLVKTAVNYKCNSVTVSVYKNSMLIEEKHTPLFDHSDANYNSSFYWGLLFCIFCLIYDWNKLFLLVGVFYMLGAFNSNSSCNLNEDSSNPLEK